MFFFTSTELKSSAKFFIEPTISTLSSICKYSLLFNEYRTWISKKKNSQVWYELNELDSKWGYKTISNDGLKAKLPPKISPQTHSNARGNFGLNAKC